jgi:hypothetical protein
MNTADHKKSTSHAFILKFSELGTSPKFLAAIPELVVARMQLPLLVSEVFGSCFRSAKSEPLSYRPEGACNLSPSERAARYLPAVTDIPRRSGAVSSICT